MKELTLREIQLAELDMLIALDKICKENGIGYSLYYGTLLGAVRHKGFIPWDDDIDVAMARPDYEKFINLISEKKNLLPENLDYVADRGKNARIPFLKIIDKNIVIESKTGEVTDNLWIDVFPVDGYPAEDKKAIKFWKKAHKCHRIIIYNYENCSNKKGLKKIALKLFSIYARMYGVPRAVRKLERLRAKYPYDSAACVGLVSWISSGIKMRMSKDTYEKYISMQFEGKEFSVIECWDKYLKQAYGDYMRLPSENERVSHGVKAFKIKP